MILPSKPEIKTPEKRQAAYEKISCYPLPNIREIITGDDELDHLMTIQGGGA